MPLIQAGICHNPHKHSGNSFQSVVYRGDFCNCFICMTLVKPVAAKPMWKGGFRYKRAGVQLIDLSSGPVQCSLFDSPEEQSKNKRMMVLLDGVNSSMGAGTLHFAATGFTKVMQMKQLQKSPRYTTDWNELPECLCGL